MSEKMPQSEVDSIFSSLISGDGALSLKARNSEVYDQSQDEGVIDPAELHRHLVAIGYNDAEIKYIFDLIKDEKGDIHEV